MSRAFLFSGAPVFCTLLCFFGGLPCKQVLVNRCSCTHVASISSLVERILAGTEHTSFFLCFAPPPPPPLIHGKGGGGEGTLSVLLYSFTWLFYELRYFSPSVFLSPYPSWKSHLSVRKFVCSVVLEPWVIAFLVVCHYRDFCSQCVGVSEEKRA